jgi:hypothetical protein
MGATLVKFYDFVETAKGRAGMVELAKATKIGSLIAASTPDSPDNIAKFKVAVKQITGKDPPF